MATIALHLDDSIQLLTLKTMLEAAGHRVHRESDRSDTEFIFCSLDATAGLLPSQVPVVVLASPVEVEAAVRAMQNGAWGYIAVPFQPREAELMVARALQTGSSRAELTLNSLQTMEEVEFEHIERALRLCNGNQAKAARILKIGRNTLWRKLKKMGLSRDDG